MLGTARTGSRHPPTLPRLCRAGSRFPPPGSVASRPPKPQGSWLTGASVCAPGLCPGHSKGLCPQLSHLVLGHQHRDEQRGPSRLFALDEQRRVVTQGMGCDTGDCPVFPCSLQQLEEGEDSHPSSLSPTVGGRTSFFFFFLIHYYF